MLNSRIRSVALFCQHDITSLVSKEGVIIAHNSSYGENRTRVIGLNDGTLKMIGTLKSPVVVKFAFWMQGICTQKGSIYKCMWQAVFDGYDDTVLRDCSNLKMSLIVQFRENEPARSSKKLPVICGQWGTGWSG